jgi:hypothetical protein
MKRLLPEAVSITLVSLLLCQSSWTGSFSYEFFFFTGLAMFVLVFTSLFVRFQKETPSFNIQRNWLGYYLALLVLPVGISLLYSVKYGLCSFVTGIEWFLLLPLVTTIFSTCSVFFSFSFQVKTWQRILIALSPSVLFSVLTIKDLYFDPSLAFFHPVIGYFPGPFYDEWIPMFSTLFTYRIWVLFLALFLWMYSSLGKTKWALMLIVLSPLLFRGQLDWHHSHKDIQKILGSRLQSKYSTVFFEGLNVVHNDAFGKSIDFYVEYISDQLKLPLPKEKIRVYVYRGAYQKKKLTGTGHTLVGNPMQNALHILPTEASDTIIVHELAHVISAPMGIPLLKLSPRVSLLEGLATAMQPSQLDLSIHEWAKAMLDLEKLPDLETALNAFSFWKENPVRVYFSSGSFSKWLIDTYGIERFKKVYLGSSFHKTYDKSLQDLIAEWKKFISTYKIPQESIDTADYFFSAKPFHQKKCVHEVAEAEMRFFTCNKKTDDCGEFIDKACSLDPENPSLRLKRARYLYRLNPSALDTTMLPLPSASSTRTQNNLIQLMNDDFHRLQNPSEAYNLEKYDHPSSGLVNTILTRIFLSRYSQDVLNGILLGDYVPDTDLTWNTKDPNYNHAMLYFAKLGLQEKQAHKSIHFLENINLKQESLDFQRTFWQLNAEANEMLTVYSKAIQAHHKVAELSMTDGDKKFAEFQIQRLTYLENN